MSDLLKKITELIEDGVLNPPSRPEKKIEVNFMDAVYYEDYKISNDGHKKNI